MLVPFMTAERLAMGVDQSVSIELPVMLTVSSLLSTTETAWRRVYAGRKSLWALSHDPAVERGLQNAYFAARGLVSLVGLHRGTQQTIVVQGQLMLFKTS
jgi:hypothetical protein